MLCLLFFVFSGDKDMLKLISLDKTWEHNLEKHEVFRTRALAVNDEDVVGVIDRDANRVVLISGDGESAVPLGKSGQGPGELSGPVEITWSRSEKVFVVLDRGNTRVSKWNSAGELQKEYPITINGLYPRLADKNTLIMVRDAFGFGGTASINRISLKKDKAKELIKHTFEKNTRFTNAGNNQTPLQVAFRWDPKLVFDLGSDFLATAFTGKSEITITDHKGKTLKTFPVKIPRHKVADDQIEEGIGLMPNNMHADLRAGMVRPEYWPYIREVFVDDKDRIWVIGSSRDTKASHAFRVYNRDGNMIGRGYVPKVPLYIGNGGVFYLDEVKVDDEEAGTSEYKLHVVKGSHNLG
ncbi:MAG: hypothetical protein QNK37_20360 [Acidobacteriota bacterium]|nr:hypothetical protein [Acidobacteriota bacterium]